MKRSAGSIPVPSESLVTGQSPTLDSVIYTMRSIWNAVEKASETDQCSLKAEVTEDVNRLKDRVESQLRKSSAFPSSQRSFFSRGEKEQASVFSGTSDRSVER